MRFLFLFSVIFAQLLAEDSLIPVTFGGVNALTGDFAIEEEDLCIEGAEPLYIRRTYASGDHRSSYGGWEFFPHLKLELLDKEKEHNYYIVVAEPSGARITYTRQDGDGKTIYAIDFKKHGKGILNCTQRELSARTNLKNNTACRYDKNHIRIRCASGGERSYVRFEDHASEFFLEWERLPNGNYIVYEYDYKKSSTPYRPELRCVSTQNPSRSKTYASAKFRYNVAVDSFFSVFNAHGKQIQIEASDGRTLFYEFNGYVEGLPGEHHDNNSPCLLKKVTSSSTPEERIGYYYPHDGKERALVTSRKFPKGKFRRTLYYTGNDVSRHDPRIDRVKEICTSAGPEGAEVCCYRFAYSIKEKEDNSYVDCGKTEVRDTDNNRTVIHFAESLYPTRIEYFQGENHVAIWKRSG